MATCIEVLQLPFEMPEDLDQGVFWLAAAEELEDEQWCASRPIGLFINCNGKD